MGLEKSLFGLSFLGFTLPAELQKKERGFF
jgi:hypothetical protein